MRFFCFAALTISSLSLSLAGTPAAARPETSTYIDGNITGVTPNSGGTLLFPSEKAMQFRTGLATVDVPYANITKAELGGKQIHSHNAPVYKVWALPKRLGSKTQTQLLVLEFKNDEGEAKAMTLELAAASASNVATTINSHRGDGPAVTQSTAAPATTNVASARKSKKRQTETATAAVPVTPAPEWWGDDYWKTTRNADKWNRAADAAAAAKPVVRPAPAEKASQMQQ